MWPAPMVQHILRGVYKERKRRSPEIFAVEPQEGTEGEIPNDEEDEEEAEEDAEQGISDEQKQMVHRLHVNLGHLPLDRMKIMLKAANAKEEVMVYVRDKYTPARYV